MNLNERVIKQTIETVEWKSHLFASVWANHVSRLGNEEHQGSHNFICTFVIPLLSHWNPISWAPLRSSWWNDVVSHVHRRVGNAGVCNSSDAMYIHRWSGVDTWICRLVSNGRERLAGRWAPRICGRRGWPCAHENTKWRKRGRTYFVLVYSWTARQSRTIHLVALHRPFVLSNHPRCIFHYASHHLQTMQLTLTAKTNHVKLNVGKKRFFCFLAKQAMFS